MNSERGCSPSCRCNEVEIAASLEDGHEQFYSVRTACPVLRDLIVPDKIFDEHRKVSFSPLDSANHMSIPRLAFLRGELNKFCSPLHDVLMVDGKIHRDITSQFRKDLQETWILQPTHLERFEQTRRFMSRWMEIKFAQWLESKGWRTSSMEALGGKFDYSGFNPEGVKSDFEVKYIPKEDVAYELNVAAFNDENGVAVGHFDIYSPVDYLLLRIANAAKQLRKSVECRIVCIIAEEYHRALRIPLSDNPPWIELQDPQFTGLSEAIDPLLKKERAKNPSFDSDLITDIALVNEVWIMTPTNGFGLECKHVIYPKAPSI